MRKLILIIILFCTTPLLNAQQRWDELYYLCNGDYCFDKDIDKYAVYTIDYQYRDTVISCAHGYFETPNKFILTKYEDYSKPNYALVTYIPKQILDDYKVGYRCYKAGSTFISIGAFAAFFGEVIYRNGLRHNNPDGIRYGAALLYTGGSFISVSIPLLCFGDNMKRSCNRDYKTYKLLNNN